jgi:mxaJ protein
MRGGGRWLAAALLAALWSTAATAEERVLRVCADPDNLPFSNARGEGFEDKIAALIADDMHATLEMTFRSSRRGFLRRTLQAHACDVVMGVPGGMPGAATTKPFYRSSYVFVAARARQPQPGSFDEPALRSWKIGLPALGAEGANIPPAHALAERGIVGNIVGFPVYGETSDDNPPGAIVAAVASGAIDVAIVWGPIGGYFARPFKDALSVTPILSDPRQPDLAFTYEISLGTRKDDTALRDRLDEILARRQTDLAAIPRDYGVPLVAAP